MLCIMFVIGLTVFPLLATGSSADPRISDGREGIGCFVPGECWDSVAFEIRQEARPQDCLAKCKDADNCKYFTFYEEDGFCLLLEECNDLSKESCGSSCVSGNTNCKELVCSQPGMSGQLPDIIFNNFSNLFKAHNTRANLSKFLSF